MQIYNACGVLSLALTDGKMARQVVKSGVSGFMLSVDL